MTKRFRVAAWLLCADIKLSTEVSVVVTQENRPTEAQARELIWAEADKILIPEGAGDAHAELSEVSVTGPLSEKKLVLVGTLPYAQVKEQFAALWPNLSLGLFIPDRNFYQKGGDPYASLLKDTDPLHIFRAGSEAVVLTIDGDLPAGDMRALFDRSFWLQAWVTFGDRGPRVPPELSLDAANDAPWKWHAYTRAMSDKSRLPKISDFPAGTEFVVKEFDVPLARVPGQGWFNWFGGEPRPYDERDLRVDNNWPAESFEEWIGIVEASLR